MIKAEHGVVSIEGNSLDCAVDFISIIAAFRESLTQSGLSDDAADKFVEVCGKAAYSNGIRAAQKTIDVKNGKVKERKSDEGVDITGMLMELLMDDLLDDNKEVGDEVSE